jgi:hypothetical protein
MGLERQIHGVVALGNVTGAVAVDGSKGNYFTATMTGDVTVTVTNVRPGHDLTVQLAQDVVGGHAVTWVGVTNGGAPTSTASSVSIFCIQGSTANQSTSSVIGQSVGTGVSSGAFLARSVFTSSASSPFTTGPNTNKIRVRAVGGGGGGGGCTNVAASAAGAGGGGAGGYVEGVYNVTPNTTFTFSIGALGGGGVGAVGGNGGTTTFNGPPGAIQAFGGTGGTVGTAANTLTVNAGGAGGIQSGRGDINGAGAPGESGFTLVVATPIVQGGGGGSGPFGGGGAPTTVVGSGNVALGFGAGGGGAATGASAAQNGGAGTPGLLIIEEYS